MQKIVTKILTFRSSNTILEWIACISWETSTRWQMINNVAFTILTTNSRAWVLAFISHAGFVRRTIRIEDTFGSTDFIRVTDIIG